MLKRKGENVSICKLSECSNSLSRYLDRGIVPDIVSDQTAAHDLLYGYVPENYSLEEVIRVRQSNPKKLESDAGASIAKEVRAILSFQNKGAKVFDNGNNIRTQAKGRVRMPSIFLFYRSFLRPLFERAIVLFVG